MTGWELETLFSHPSIKNYLKLIKEEQAKARVCPKKAVPLFLKKLQIIAQFILAQLQSPRISPISLYIFSRDLCFFTTDFFSGDRSSDLGRVLSREVLYFPDSSGILFNHTFGKTLGIRLTRLQCVAALSLRQSSCVPSQEF